jgi:hypothetical protein
MALGLKTGGRQKGTPNKTTGALKEAILLAAENAGGEGGLEGYLRLQAHENPTAFMSLLGKVLPLTLSGDPENPVGISLVERVILDPAKASD